MPCSDCDHWQDRDAIQAGGWGECFLSTKPGALMRTMPGNPWALLPETRHDFECSQFKPEPQSGDAPALGGTPPNSP